jgi:hypothetical protein
MEKIITKKEINDMLKWCDKYKGKPHVEELKEKLICLKNAAK